MGDKVTQQVLRRPILRDVDHGANTMITYYNGETWKNETFYKDAHHRGPVAIAVAEFFNENAFKNKGKITKEQVEELSLKFEELIKNEEFCKTQLTNQIARTKDLFQKYMLDDSDGGKDITQKEQFEIMSIVIDWFKFKFFNKDDFLDETGLNKFFK